MKDAIEIAGLCADCAELPLGTFCSRHSVLQMQYPPEVDLVVGLDFPSFLMLMVGLSRMGRE